ncbi:MAG: hypothetical protein HYU03_01345 [Thaumarchaeota archaeon]|nr:hypothetical protein [Nitrososphaerota archaeon]MCS4539323.1 hypothetical protein [Nitrososphaerota archaeon]
MVELVPLSLSFAIGVTCSLMACCLGIYPGLFAYLQSNVQNPSRLRAGLLSLGFASGVLLAVLAVSTVFVVLQLQLMSLMNQAMLYVDIVGFILMALIGLGYLTGRTIRIPLPSVSPPTSFLAFRGYLAAPVYGIFFGGPGAAHCTLMLVIPIIFLSLSALDPTAFFANFGVYAIGRVIPIVVIGMMLQDAQLRFLKLVASRSVTINRVIGIIIIISGISLFFVT